MNKIISVICPDCHKVMVKRRKENLNGGKYGEIQFVCKEKCIITYPESWFDDFTQYEEFVLREGGNKGNWEKLINGD